MEIHSTVFDRRASVLVAAIRVFGRYGYKKSSVDNIAEAAGLTKQGLYLHFSSKEEIFVASMAKYLDDAVLLLEQTLGNHSLSLHERICEAMDVWFGRHFSTFSLQSLDVIEVGNQLSARQTEKYKEAFRIKIGNALSESTEFKKSKNACSPKEIADTLFTCGLSWKEPHQSRADFAKKMSVLCKGLLPTEKIKGEVMSKVLVTGGSGFVAGHCLVQLLVQGHEVRTTLRDLKRELEIREALKVAGAHNQAALTFYQANLTENKGWAEAVNGCDFVLHVASPFPEGACRLG